jgi:uncharacterized membrane protein
MLLVNVVAYDVGRFWLYVDKQDVGKIQGHQWITKNPVNRDMYHFLRQQPAGIVLENVPANAYMESSTYAIFNGKPALLGWPSHLQTWHGDVPQMWSMARDIRAFYNGKLDDTVQWLLKNDVSYIVLSPKDNADHFNTIHTQIKAHYHWFGFHRDGQSPAGVWVRSNTR